MWIVTRLSPGASYSKERDEVMNQNKIELLLISDAVSECLLLAGGVDELVRCAAQSPSEINPSACYAMTLLTQRLVQGLRDCEEHIERYRTAL